MTSITLQSFADSSGKSAGKKKGGFSGELLGKVAEGLEALEAFAALAAAKSNLFMELAMKALKVHAQKLETKLTIPFANPDQEFNPALNPARAAMTPKAPTLGGGSSKKRQKQEE